MSKIQVVSRPPRFRRAGREFTQVPTVIAVADLKEGQLQALKEDPNLVVTAFADPEDGGGKDGKAEGGKSAKTEGGKK